MIEKPDKAIAESIKIKFEEKKLLKSTDLAAIADKLTAGMVSEEDWKLMADLSLEGNKGEGDAKKD